MSIQTDTTQLPVAIAHLRSVIAPAQPMPADLYESFIEDDLTRIKSRLSDYRPGKFEQRYLKTEYMHNIDIDNRCRLSVSFIRLERQRESAYQSEHHESMASRSNILHEMYKLCASYMANIQDQHPFLHQPQSMVENFIKRYGSDGPIESSLESAIVLLILALGEICAFQDRNGRLGKPGILPGMTYYLRAAAMIGVSMEKWSIKYAQAAILAALYMNQLAEPLKSWNWIKIANLVIEVIVQE